MNRTVAFAAGLLVTLAIGLSSPALAAKSKPRVLRLMTISNAMSPPRPVVQASSEIDVEELRPCEFLHLRIVRRRCDDGYCTRTLRRRSFGGVQPWSYAKFRQQADFSQASHLWQSQLVPSATVPIYHWGY